MPSRNSAKSKSDIGVGPSFKVVADYIGMSAGDTLSDRGGMVISGEFLGGVSRVNVSGECLGGVSRGNKN